MAPIKVKASAKDKVAQLVAAAQQRKEDAELLAGLFADILPYFDAPDTRQWNIWLRRYGVDVIAESLERTAEKYENMTEIVEKAIAEGRPVPEGLKAGWTQDEMYRYATGVMKQKAVEANG